MKKTNKRVIVVVLFFIFLLSFTATILYWRIKAPSSKVVKEEPNLVKKEEPPVPILASLTLIPEQQTIKVDQTFLVTINLNTGDYKTDTVDAVLTFDPKVLTVEKISPGMFFADYPIKKSEDGKIMLTGTIGAEDKQVGGAKGEGALGTITFKAKGKGSTTVDFDQNSLVVNEGENVLGETKGANFEIY